MSPLNSLYSLRKASELPLPCTRFCTELTRFLNQIQNLSQNSAPPPQPSASVLSVGVLALYQIQLLPWASAYSCRWALWQELTNTC